MRHKWQDIRREPRLSPAQEAQVAAEERGLQDGLTQAALAQVLTTAQPSIARLEARQDHYLSTLSDYVAALGGQLHLVATFPDGEYRLRVPAAAWDGDTLTPTSPERVIAD